MKLARDDHQALASWGAACAERTAAIFETSCAADRRPRDVIEVLRRWAAGAATVAEARAASVAAHAAARAAPNESAKAAARACGQAVAIAPMPGHARHAAAYAEKAVRIADNPEAGLRERAYQHSTLPPHLRHIWAAP